MASSTSEPASSNHEYSSNHDEVAKSHANTTSSSTFWSSNDGASSVEAFKTNSARHDRSQRCARNMSPFHRQDMLVRKLLLTRQQQGGRGDHNGIDDDRVNDAEDYNKNNPHHKHPNSRKRRYPSVVQSTPSLSPPKMESNATSECNPKDSVTDLVANGAHKTWEEISSIFPLLSYGEESNDLLSVLIFHLDVRSNYEINNDHGAGSSRYSFDESDGNNADHSHNQTKIFSAFTSALESMLQARNEIQRRHAYHRSSSQHTWRDSREIASTLSHAKKKRSTDNPKLSPSRPMTAEVTIHSPIKNTHEFLPWNVLLRITIRIASYVAKVMNSSYQRDNQNFLGKKCHANLSARDSIPVKENDAINYKENEEKGRENDNAESEIAEESSSFMHPLLQALDMVLAELHVLMRMESQRCQRLRRLCSRSIMEATAMKVPSSEIKASQGEVENSSRSRYFPKDRMLVDWKFNIENESIHTLCRSNRWGPSRFSFLKDVELITKMLGFFNQAININVVEWQEKVHSVVGALDAYVNMEFDNVSGVNKGTPDHSLVGERQTLGLGTRSSLSLSLIAEELRNSSFSIKLANVTRAHVQRLGNSMTREGKSRESSFLASEIASSSLECRNMSALTKKQPCLDTCVSTGDVQQSSNVKGSNIFSYVDVETDALVDAYRMAIAFSTSRETGRVGARETIKRRLSFIVQRLLSTQDVKNKGEALNIDGAESYLESLFCTLVEPSEPSVWVRLMKESHGKETPHMLRRGRALLVAFLVGVKAPGWKDCFGALESSPLPSYLGCLLHREEEKDSKLQPSFLLPVMRDNMTSMPIPPIITELGLNLCVRNFLHKGTLEGDNSKHLTSNESMGVCLFRNYGPLHCMSASNESDYSISSVTASLPDLRELTRDLFDLTLWLAAVNENESSKKHYSLRLATPSASDSLNILLQVVSEHSEWLQSHSISSRYRFIVEHVIQSFQCSSVDMQVLRCDEKGYYELDEKIEEDSETWEKCAACLINSASTAQTRGRIVLYATQFMTLLCTTNRNAEQNSSHISNHINKQPNFFACLHLHQLSRFWSDVDKTAKDFCSNIMTTVFDFHFCSKFLLPLSYQCTFLLAKSSFLQVKKDKTHAPYQKSQATLSLVTILCSMFKLLADDGLLKDCIHVGWAVEMLSFSVNHFIFGEDSDPSDRILTKCPSHNPDTDSVWEYVALDLKKLLCDVWGNQWRNLNIQGHSQSLEASRNYITYETIGYNYGIKRTTVLLPSFTVFVSTLIEFASSISNPDVDITEFNDVTSWCKFYAKIVFDRYAELHACYIKKDGLNINESWCGNEFSLISFWISLLASNLQKVLLLQKVDQNKCGKEVRDKVDMSSAEQMVTDLITPAIRNLHSNIVQRVLQPSVFLSYNKNDHSERNPSSDRDIVAFVFVDLFKKESATFLNQPTPAKTRKWGLYRICIEKIFLMTPPLTLFARPGDTGLTEYSADALDDIWNQYGQCNLSYSILIMVAAGLHVNASATRLRRDQLLQTKHDVLSAQLKQRYNAFSSRAKVCIISTFHNFQSQEKRNHISDNRLRDLNVLLRTVRRRLSFHEAEVGVTWWNEITADLFSHLANPNDQSVHHTDSNKSATRRDIAKVFSTLENSLSAISRSK